MSTDEFAQRRKKLGERLKFYRESVVVGGKQGVSQDRLADLLSAHGRVMERSTISHWENGNPRRRLPRPDEIEDIALVLGLTEWQRDDLLESLLEAAGYPSKTTSELTKRLLREMEDVKAGLEKLAQTNTLKLDAYRAKWMSADVLATSPFTRELHNPATSVTYWSRRPTSIGKNLIGREEELDLIANAFGNHRVVVISGGVGFGKTRLAAEYVHRSGAQGFWTDAGSDVTQTLVALGSDLGIHVQGRNENEIAGDVQRKLCMLSDDTLWCIEGLNDLDIVNGLLNVTGPVRLLISTRDDRQHLLPDIVVFLRLGTLSPEKAVELLCLRSNITPEDPLLWKLAKAVGYLPMALEVLAVCLGSSFQDLEALLCLIQMAPNPIQLAVFQEAAGATIPRAEGVFATLAGALASLPTDVREQLSPLGYVTDVPLSKVFLSHITGVGNDELTRLVEECRHRSVMSMVDDQPRLHTLMIAAIAATNANKESVLAELVMRCESRLNTTFNKSIVGLREEVAHCQQVLAWAREMMSMGSPPVIQLAIELANSLGTLDRREEAFLLAREARDASEDLYGQEHKLTVECGYCLALRHNEAGHFNESIQLLEQNLPIAKKILGPYHESTLMICHSLAVEYFNTDRNEDAIALLEPLSKARKHEMGLTAVDIYIDLAVAYSEVGRKREAAQLLEDAQSVIEEVPQSDYLRDRSLRFRLANAYYKLSRYGDALRLFEQIVIESEFALGDPNLDTLYIRIFLAECNAVLGNPEQAQHLVDEALPDLLKSLGPNHPRTLTVLSLQARIYRDQERLEETIDLLEPLHPAMEAIFGPDHINTIHVGLELVQGYVLMCRYKDAISLAENILEASIHRYGRDDVTTISSSFALSLSYHVAGRFSDNILLLEESLPVVEKYYGRSHEITQIMQGMLMHARIQIEAMEAKAVNRTQNAKIGRNTRCPCGSGRKYKRCCGR